MTNTYMNGKLINRSAVLNTVVNHAAQQGVVCMNKSGSCAYRGYNNTKCFIGALIPDSAYWSGMEGYSFNPIVSRAVFDTDDLTGEDYIFMRDLQGIHDEDYPQNWREKFLSFAVKYDISPSVILSLDWSKCVSAE